MTMMEMLPAQLARQEILQIWRQEPLMAIDGVEVLRRTRAKRKGLENQTEEMTFQDLYILKREQIINDIIPSKNFKIDTVLGPAGGGKGTILQGLRRLYIRDPLIQREAKRITGRPFRIIDMPFALYALAAKSEIVHQTLPRFAISPQKKHGGYAAEDYKKVAGLMKHDFKTYIQNRGGGNGVGLAPGEVGTVLIEPSANTYFPYLPENMTPDTAHKKIAYVGMDRIQSVIYSIVTNDTLKKNTDIYGIEQNHQQTQFAQELRRAIFAEPRSDEEMEAVLSKIEQSGAYLLLQRKRGKEVEDVRFGELDKEGQIAVMRFARGTMSPESGVQRMNNERINFRTMLYTDGLITEDTDAALLEAVAHNLGMEGQVNMVQSEFLPPYDERALDLTYLIKDIKQAVRRVSIT
jgi:hypothetical protein